MRIFGDVHDNVKFLESIARNNKEVPVVIAGDVAFGFNHTLDNSLVQVFSDNPNMRHIRGNHQNPAVTEDVPGFIPDGTVENGILYIGGAWSIDLNYRTPMYDWWPNEELSDEDWDELVYPKLDQEIHTVISHDGPDAITSQLHRRFYNTSTGYHLERVRQILRGKVKRWVFGHHHMHRDFELDGCHFTVLMHENTNSFVDL